MSALDLDAKPLGPARMSRGFADAFRAFRRQDAGMAERREAQKAMRAAADCVELIELLAKHGLEADSGIPYTFEGRGWWREPLLALQGELPGQDPDIYQCAIESSAQVGKTANAIVTLGTKALRDRSRGVRGWAGIYWPDMLMAQQYSQARVDPMLRSLARTAGAQLGGYTAEGDNIPKNATTKGFAGWILVFMWLHGKGVDGIPASRLLVDEVRLADPARVDRVESRLLGSLHREIGSICYLSTAGFPGDAMSVRWRQSTQHRFHHPCACPGGVDLVDLLRATFPAGSITGAPKQRCMEILEDLELVRRGVYTGAVGWVGPGTASGPQAPPGPSMHLNVAIRTMTLRQGVVRCNAGGGITARSDPATEYEETLHKAEGMFRALDAEVERS